MRACHITPSNVSALRPTGFFFSNKNLETAIFLPSVVGRPYNTPRWWKVWHTILKSVPMSPAYESEQQDKASDNPAVPVAPRILLDAGCSPRKSPWTRFPSHRLACLMKSKECPNIAFFLISPPRCLQSNPIPWSITMLNSCWVKTPRSSGSSFCKLFV